MDGGGAPDGGTVPAEHVALPDELLLLIFSSLPLADKRRFANVCRAWRRFRPADIVVDERGPPHGYRSISEAIERAGDDEIVRVRAGRYEETLHLSKRIHIVGEPGAVLASGSKSRSKALALLICGGPAEASPSVHGLRICAEGEQPGVFIYGGSQARIERCDISATSVGVVVMGAGTGPGVRGCAIHGCRTAVLFVKGADGVMEGNELHGNVDGVTIGPRCSPLLLRNRLRDQRTGVFALRGAGGRLEGNVFAGRGRRLELEPGARCVVREAELGEPAPPGLVTLLASWLARRLAAWYRP
eukprot:tig00000448_g902.t1